MSLKFRTSDRVTILPLRKIGKVVVAIDTPINPKTGKEEDLYRVILDDGESTYLFESEMELSSK
jgi:hypothetical protein